MSKYTSEQVEAEADCLPDAYEDQAAKLRDYAALLRERESAKAAVTDETVETACKAASLHSDDAIFPDDYGDGEADDVRNYMRAALEAVAPMLASARVPDGWQPVPVEPTDEMIENGIDQHECVQGDSWYIDSLLSENDCIAIYKAMLAAAPKPETEE